MTKGKGLKRQKFLLQIPVMKEDRIVNTTNWTYPWSYVNQVMMVTIILLKWWFQLSHYEASLVSSSLL